MVTIDKIVLEDIKDPEYPYKNGYIDMPLKLFGQMRFEDDDEKLGLSIPATIDLEAIIEPLNDYLLWLSDCRAALETFYLREHKEWIDECYDGELDDEWYNSLEMYSGTIDIDEDGAFSANFSCGDNMNDDHLLIIEISGKEINDMWFDG
ncbi:hypothetical protein [Dysgonomonas sp. 25]|uniref:hypothetical protein n=1 Tax=Dysgonomonas sp. 25 TaxID=2302933 RepID=UPI0013D1DEBD|nr:hypothetical protein [Dysgonomonas sp. 25]